VLICEYFLSLAERNDKKAESERGEAVKQTTSTISSGNGTI